jgi:hypothetical protein
MLPAALWPWSWTSLEQKWVPGIFLRGKGKGRPARRTDNLTAICESISRKCGSLDVSQPRGPPGIALLSDICCFQLFWIWLTSRVSQVQGNNMNINHHRARTHKQSAVCMFVSRTVAMWLEYNKHAANMIPSYPHGLIRCSSEESS